ncbi:MAG: succinylglutamate desuccinylase/aspartoacylase family protein [Pseudomonadota bacterium]
MIRRQRLLVLLTAALGMLSSAVASPNADLLANALARHGERTTLTLTVDAGSIATTIPITVVAGSRPGKTLLALAGVHGSEYSPIIATQRLAPRLDPTQLQGAVIFVHTANVPAYFGRTIYSSPADGKNLNRVFPGRADGTLTERIAHTLTSVVYPHADAALDLHSGDGNEQLRPSWVGYYAKSGTAQTIAASRAMALAFGLPSIVEFQSTFSGPEEAIWGGSAAVMQGIPSIDVEAGGMGIIDEVAIAQIEDGLLRVMDHLGILPADLDPPPPARFIRERGSISAPAEGAWVALIDAGTPVTEGELIGYLTNLHGERIFEARAPMAGTLLIRLEAPPVLRGETLAVIGRYEAP